MMKRGTVFLALIFLLTAIGAKGETAGEKSSGRDGMVFIAAGEFEMGDRRSRTELNPLDILNPDRHMLGPENPAHAVNLDAFHMDIYEVTNADYEKYMKSPNAGEVRKPQFRDDPDYNNPGQPVVGISWKEARRYCFWSGKRLPTEAEWEKAARGNMVIHFPWGNEEPDNSKLNFNNEVGKPVKVGSYEAGKSVFGIYDLSGNVSEWVFDWHDPEAYLFFSSENPKGPSKGQYKVIRGGNWRNNRDEVSLTFRGATVSKVRNKTVGFRCAADARE